MCRSRVGFCGLSCWSGYDAWCPLLVSCLFLHVVHSWIGQPGQTLIPFSISICSILSWELCFCVMMWEGNPSFFKIPFFSSVNLIDFYIEYFGIFFSSSVCFHWVDCQCICWRVSWASTSSEDPLHALCLYFLLFPRAPSSDAGIAESSWRIYVALGTK